MKKSPKATDCLLPAGLWGTDSVVCVLPKGSNKGLPVDSFSITIVALSGVASILFIAAVSDSDERHSELLLFVVYFLEDFCF